jgi:hypothetical protein
LFLLVKTGQDPVDDVLVLNTSDDSDRSAAAAADFAAYVIRCQVLSIRIKLRSVVPW